MPENKRGQRPGGRRGKGTTRTTAKKISSKPVKRQRVAAVATPMAKRRAAKVSVKAKTKRHAVADKLVVKRKTAEIEAKPVAKRKAAEVVVKPTKRKADAALVKPAAKRKMAEAENLAEAVAKPIAAEIGVKPVKRRKKADFKAKVTVECAAAEPVIEPILEYRGGYGADYGTEYGTADAGDYGLEPMVDGVAATRIVEPLAEGWVEVSRNDSAVETGAADFTAESVATQSAVDAAGVTVEEGIAENSATKPFVERRVAAKSILERRLVDPAAKERRRANSAKKEGGAEDSSAKSSQAKWSVEPNVADQPVSAERGGENVAAEFRGREQQNLFNETAVWMRKSSTLLIGLNALTLIAVLILGRGHSSQVNEMAAMRNAAVTQMQKAAASSSEAAYAACLGSQTARSMLLELKPGATEPRGGSRGSLQPVAAADVQAAQIKFDVEKLTSVNVHVPVLFHVGVENVGSSSALNAKVWGEVKVLDSGSEPDFKYDDAALTKKAISPGEPEAKVVLYTTDAGMVVPLKDAEYQRVTSGQAYVVAYGKALYEDVNGAHHWAEFCHYITEPNGARKHSNRCANYNGSGVTDLAARPAEMPRGPQNAAVILPEIACEVPKEEKNTGGL